MIQACSGGSARSITGKHFYSDPKHSTQLKACIAVMPYFPYSRQSKKKTHRGAITARMVANLMKVAGVTHVITIDLHASQMQGFFKCPVDNLVAEPLLAKWIKMNIPEWWESVVVSKNAGGTKRVTSLADAMKLSFGIVTTDRRRPHMSSSMYNSVVFESMGTDGTNDRRALERDAEEAEGALRDASTPKEHDFARHRSGTRTNGDYTETVNQKRRPSRPRAATTTQTPNMRRLVNGDTTSSPLSQSSRPDSADAEEENAKLALHKTTTAPGIGQPRKDEDGYEDPADGDDSDELARDVITGRLIHGHIVDDDVPSPTASVRSGSVHGNNHGQRASQSSDEAVPDHMMQSFMSTASSRAPHAHGLGGTGDATASDDEEEEALKDPEIETTVTLVGNVHNKPVLIVDDMIDRAGSWVAAAETVVKRGGATKVYCMATHGLFGGDSLSELDACDEIEAVIVTDAFPIPEEKRRLCKKLVVLDVSGLLSEAIRRNHHGESISQLYYGFD